MDWETSEQNKAHEARRLKNSLLKYLRVWQKSLDDFWYIKLVCNYYTFSITILITLIVALQRIDVQLLQRYSLICQANHN
jgi:hypothetical protein